MIPIGNFYHLPMPKLPIDLYDSYPDRNLKFGISDAQTYHWLHAMNAIGSVDASITSNHPLAVAFTDDSGTTTYSAHNYSNNAVSVSFSDGYVLEASANKLTTSRDLDISGSLRSDFDQAYVGGSVRLTYDTTSTNIDRVEFYDGTTLISSDTSAPFEAQATNLGWEFMECMQKFMSEQNSACPIIFLFKLGSKFPMPLYISYPEQSKRVISIHTKRALVKILPITTALKIMTETPGQVNM